MNSKRNNSKKRVQSRERDKDKTRCDPANEVCMYRVDPKMVRADESFFFFCYSYLLPGVRLDLREFELGVVGVHFAYLVTRRRAQDLDYLDQLVHTTVAGEDGLAQQELSQYATRAPHICLSKNWCNLITMYVFLNKSTYLLSMKT